MKDLYFMSPPSAGWALKGRANFRSREAEQVDARAARREWLALAEAIEERGGTVVALYPPSDDLTGMPYAAECGHVVTIDQRPVFVLPNMIAPHRRAERAWWELLARDIGIETATVDAGIWEGQGDVATFDGATLLFFGGRTDRAGMEAASRFFRGEVIEVGIRDPAFHGNMAVLPLPAVDRVLACPSVIAEASYQVLARRFGARRILPVSEDEIRRYATNGLLVGDDLLVPSVTPPRVIDLVSALGVRVVSLPMRELCEKAGGASRCLVSIARVPEVLVRLREEHGLAYVRDRIAREDG